VLAPTQKQFFTTFRQSALALGFLCGLFGGLLHGNCKSVCQNPAGRFGVAGEFGTLFRHLAASWKTESIS